MERRRRLLAGASALTVLVTVLLGVGQGGDDPADATTLALRVAPAEASPPDASAVLTALPGEAVPTRDEAAPAGGADLAAAAREVAAAVRRPGARTSVGVTDLGTGRTLVTDDARYRTASVVKVDVLLGLLLREGRLTSRQLRLADAMITVSDNDATDVLLREVGGERALEVALGWAGLTETDVGGWTWGRTTTTVADRLRLLDAIFSPDSRVPGEARALVGTLMARVVEEQRLGVTAAADDPDRAALKAGWVDADDGTWVVGSIGRVERDGRTYLVAVLSDGHPSFSTGVQRVERAARLGVTALAALPAP